MYQGPWGSYLMKKTRGRKSCDTVPLSYCFWNQKRSLPVLFGRMIGCSCVPAGDGKVAADKIQSTGTGTSII
jgi:hypothetical protein